HWSVRKLARDLQISKDAVHRIWRTAGLKTHRFERYMASDDPDFERKAADVIGLYLQPPQHDADLCVDEYSAIKALVRLDHVLPCVAPDSKTTFHAYLFFVAQSGRNLVCTDRA